MEPILHPEDKEDRRHGTEDFPFALYDNYLRYPYFSRYTIDPHWHEEMEFLLVVRGNARVLRDGEFVEVGEGEALFIPPRTFHAAESLDHQPFHFIALVFHLDLLEGEVQDVCHKRYFTGIKKRLLSFPGVISRKTLWGKAVLHELMEVVDLADHKGPGYELGIKGALFKVFSLIFSNGVVQKSEVAGDVYAVEKILPALEYIKEHYQEEISVDDLAKLVYLSKYHFIREFKRLTGRTPVAFINRYRVHKAMAMLIESDEKVLNVAYECGFNDMSYFIRLFHRFTGLTPAQYRRAYAPRAVKTGGR
ncbi:transcriptional regulator with cupin sensor, AraC family [Spirochaeta thermophila DSM 6578]|uniref:Transcriptional regulator with cupin sensor, AraC family n=1 Tax=Winmispira thermophila (strain ATCC 700085 / DSM 6578 / Z-1203) TaxID=869211 RepID=G0GE20_WINT7|nr:AraC family transcriptional regulator [Spirochaeta thermophila]AEJ60652.1 transcriptional regulator with cupin sensor, AraC family [Spirochaeta thermophila DSM 6578]